MRRKKNFSNIPCYVGVILTGLLFLAATCEESISLNVDLSEFGYKYVWDSIEGFPVGGDAGEGELGYVIVTNTAGSVEECAYRCRKIAAFGGQYGYENYPNRCFCETSSIVCREPAIYEAGGIVFSSAEKPPKCAQSFCDYFWDLQNTYCSRTDLAFQPEAKPENFEFHNTAVALANHKEANEAITYPKIISPSLFGEDDQGGSAENHIQNKEGFSALTTTQNVLDHSASAHLSKNGFQHFLVLVLFLELLLS